MEWDNLDIFDDSLDKPSGGVGFTGRPSVKGFGNSRRSSAVFRQDKRVKCDTSDVALIESPIIKPKTANDSFEGFSIVRNRVPSAANSPFSKSEDFARTLLPRPRNSSFSRSLTAAIPSSPHEFHTPMAYPHDAEKLTSQLQGLKDDVREKDEEIARLRSELAAATAAKQAAQEDANATKFMCSLQEQRIEELEQQVSRERLEHSEDLRSNNRKNKLLVKKLTQDRASYEERADLMIKQMNDQMTQLQQMAMSRIETLENELMAQRHSNDKLQAECTRLHACAAAAMASATKHRQLVSSFGLGSPSSASKTLFSSSGTLRSAEKRRLPRRERHSSTGTTSTYTSTQVHEEEEEDDVEVEGEGYDEDKDGEEQDGEGSGTECDENDSRSNTPLASPGGSPSRDLRAKPQPAQARPQGAAVDEEYWATQI